MKKVEWTLEKTENVLLTEGCDIEIVNIETYVKENGYSERNIAICLIIISSIIIIWCLIKIKKIESCKYDAKSEQEWWFF